MPFIPSMKCECGEWVVISGPEIVCPKCGNKMYPMMTWRYASDEARKADMRPRGAGASGEDGK